MDPNYFFYGDYKETGFNLYFEDHGDILNISMTAFHYYSGKTYLEAVWAPIYLKNNPQSYIARYLAIQIKDALDKFSMSFEETYHFKIPEFHQPNSYYWIFLYGLIFHYTIIYPSIPCPGCGILRQAKT